MPTRDGPVSVILDQYPVSVSFSILFLYCSKTQNTGVILPSTIFCTGIILPVIWKNTLLETQQEDAIYSMTAQKKIDQADWVRYYHKTQTMTMWLINYFARSINRVANTAAAHCTTQLLVVHVYSEPCENIGCHFFLTNNSAMPNSVIDLSEDELPAPIGKRKATDKSSAAKKKSASKIVAIFWRGDLLRRFYSQHFTDGVK